MKFFTATKGMFYILITLFSCIANASWTDIQSDIAISMSKPVIDRADRVYVVQITLTNSGETVISGPLRLLIENSTIELINSDGSNDQGIPYINIALPQIAAGNSATASARFALDRKTLTFDTTLQNLDPNAASYVEAEGGGAGNLVFMGSEFNLTDGDPGYVWINSTDANPPTDDNRVIQLEVTFPQAATYELYARLRVGAGAANDDSFFAPDSLGVNNGWVLINSIAGFSAPGESGYQPGEPVVAGGSSVTQAWKWTKLAGITYTVAENALTQTFRFAGREDGLDIDKFAFAQQGVLFTIEQLENGLPGDVIPPPEPFVPEGPPMAEGKDKFVGGVCCGRQAVNFTAYWNQVTPENAGKWGSAEPTRDVFNWTELDQAYNMAKDNGFIYKHHVLVWGNQQPAWISALPAEEQLEEILEWYHAVNDRYADIDFIEVVNEFDNDPPNSANNGPGYIDALRLFDPDTTAELITHYTDLGMDQNAAAAQAARFDWIINAFQMARNIFPSTTQLMINEYSVINTASRTSLMIELVELLDERGLIDAIGFQGHAFSTTGNNQNMLDNIDRLAATGFDLYVTELDIDGPTDLIQLIDYQRLFPMFWNHPAIKGITMWGYLPGHWRENQGAHLAFENGAEKPALVWLKGYVRGVLPLITDPGQVETSSSATVGSTLVNLQTTTINGSAHPDDATITWSILGGSGAELFTIDADTGEITVSGSLTLSSYNLLVQVQVDEYISTLLDLNISVEGGGAPEPTVITYDFISGLQGWRGDYGTPTVVNHNAVEQAAEIVPDWSVNVQNIIGQISETDYTGASVEYSLRITQAQADAGMTAQGYVQTGAQSSYARMYGPVVPLTAGVNTLTFTPTDNGNNDIRIIERVSLQLNGPLAGTAAESDTVLLDKVTVTLPPAGAPPTTVEYNFLTDAEGWRNDYGTNSVVGYDPVAQAAEIVPDWTANSQNLIKQISQTDYAGTSIEYTITVTQAQVDGGLTAQGYVQTGDPNYARMYGPIEPLIAGTNTFSFSPTDNGNGDIAIIERVALQLNGPLTDGTADSILLNNVTITFP
ncbi:endo-1,4-beta-xylanase [Neptunicella sp. SCSIO 80796]|uniref:endo-1,4-beta-xylanase n=1 Tax=Neptunicella plasticusilytica TaxID=3117012 RepID=UPI003A4D6744